MFRAGFMGKAKPAKHTAAEIKAKVAAATTNKGGGNAGKEDRLGGKAGHAKYKCPVCAQQAPDMKTMQIHFEAKHPKLPWEQDKIIDMHALVGATTQGIAIRGSTKKK
ncbi:Protein METHYLENE BLUE SENSITIVITY 1 [Coccomyxa sp. Obi]|nr:Protein METHYLENE BLUE SENSITIVITY 1 [Coccomyxa sp. Obi]